jgi:hypothetical protein
MKAGASFVPTIWGVTIDETDRAFFLLDEIPNHRLDAGNPEKKQPPVHVERLDQRHKDRPAVTSGVESMDRPKWSDRLFQMRVTPELSAGLPQAIWFDLIHIAGDPADATLTLYATDSGCTTMETLGSWGMADILSQATQWLSTCVTVTPHQPTAGIGFRFSSAQVDLGMEGPWFGPACPP